MPDKWITSNGRHILLGPNGEIKGGAVPKEAQGKNIKEWAAEPENKPPEPKKERKSKPQQPGETKEEYKKRAAKERRELRKKARAELREIMSTTPPEEPKVNHVDIVMDAVREAMKNPDTDLTDVRKVFLDELSKQIPLGGKIEDYSVKTSGPINQYVRPNVEVKRKLDKALALIPTHLVEYLNQGHISITLDIQETRAYAKPLMGELTIGAYSPPSVVAHELMHIIEHRQSMYAKDYMEDYPMGQANKQFIKDRAKGEKAKWLGPPYDKEEVAVFDSFSEPYIGKHYDHPNITEVASMGIEMLHKGDLLYHYMEKDPGFVEHIIKILHPNTFKGKGMGS